MDARTMLKLRFAESLAEYRRLRRQNPDIRPFVVELFGTPKAGKSTTRETVRHLLDRNGWEVSAPPEGAEVIRRPRTTPHYNLETCRYALSQLYHDSHGDYEVIILDRGLMDGVMWLDYWRKKGKLDAATQKVIEDFYMLPLLRDQFDLQICMVCEPEVALAREVANTLTDEEGETMNPASMQKLYDSHRDFWERRGKADPKMCLIDTTSTERIPTVLAALDAIAAAFERRLKSL